MIRHRLVVLLGFLSQINRPVNPIIGLILLVACPSQAIFSQNPRAGLGPTAICVLDAGRDGRADVAVANSLDDNVSLLVGLGGGGFAAPRNFGVGVAPSSVLSGDTDGDGRTDLVVGNSDGTVSLLRASGPNEFFGALTVAADIAVIPPAMGDLDGDRIMDLVVASRSPRRVAVLGGNAGWSDLTQRALLVMIGQPIAMAVEDLNRDGRPDLAIARRNADGVSVFLNAGAGRFSSPNEYAAGENPTSITVADATGDGRFDVVVTNEQPDRLTILAGDETGHMGGPVFYTVGRAPQRALAGDVNGDTIPDLVTVNSFEDTVSLLIGRRSADFEPALDFTVGITPLDVALADFSGDGRPDVMTVNIDEDDLSLLLNTSDHVVLLGDVDSNGRIGQPDIDATIAELFDGDGDCPFDAARGFAAQGAQVNSNNDARVTSADIVGVFRTRNR